ncbi:undecaprenyl-diphosphatase [Risungbinella massiliensis]|uniref:undecaprenyl-diphosphatase n=1 Tax=Risungbinella massiliensis TaxID=1329796 RepID=UPI0005CC6AD1|nr:undecaprenyl-diphosphatase [Risungbinella massiliensis]
MSIPQFNIDVFRAINDLGKEFSSLNPVVIFVAEYTLYLLALSIVVYWFTYHNGNRVMVIRGGVAFILAEIAGKIAGLLHSHYQPFAVLSNVSKLVEHEIDNSFPSDHTILFFSFCFSFWLANKKSGWPWLVLAFCVGISRIWVGVHYPIDVAVGALFGMVAALLVYWMEPKFSFTKQLIALYDRAEQYMLPSSKRSRNY